LTIDIAIVGTGPAGLTFACALAQEGGYSIHLFERDQDHFEIATYNPNRSYTIDITGHGLNTTQRIDKMAPAAWLYRIGFGYNVDSYVLRNIAARWMKAWPCTSANG
jgi:2-polyprenyl-6-methoxyphenol hydroxylase-like FAD-dependent oxidoreductase